MMYLVAWGTVAVLVEAPDAQQALHAARVRYRAPRDARVRPATKRDRLVFDQPRRLAKHA